MGYSINDRLVQGNLFTENGKWKYTVVLDYTGLWDALDPNEAARTALRQATDKGISGVTLREVPQGWWLAVLEPYTKYSYPVLAVGL
jgi:hypothetical protein